MHLQSRKCASKRGAPERNAKRSSAFFLRGKTVSQKDLCDQLVALLRVGNPVLVNARTYRSNNIYEVFPVSPWIISCCNPSVLRRSFFPVDMRTRSNNKERWCGREAGLKKCQDLTLPESAESPFSEENTTRVNANAEKTKRREDEEVMENNYELLKRI